MMSQAWHLDQLVEFVGLFSGDDEMAFLERATDRMTDALDAEIAVVSIEDQVVRSHGLTGTRVGQANQLSEMTNGSHRVHLEALGEFEVLVCPFPVQQLCGRVVLARTCDQFDVHEVALARAMARTMSMALQLIRASNRQQQLHAELEQTAGVHVRLVEQLQQRQSSLECLFEIQRAIADRRPEHQVLGEIVADAAWLMGATVGLRLVNDTTELCDLVWFSNRGETTQRNCSTPVTSGYANRAILHDALQEFSGLEPWEHAEDFECNVRIDHMLSAPVRRNGQPVGCVFVGRDVDEPAFDDRDRSLLLTLCELATLCLNDHAATGAIESSLAAAQYESTHDMLTGLVNRREVVEQTDAAIAAGRQVAVFFVDLDRFKIINDAFGHAAGDAVLCEVAQRLVECVRDDDIVARLAGDEFVVVAFDCAPHLRELLARRLLQQVSFDTTVAGKNIEVSASVGVAVVEESMRAEDLIADADVAMYRAKRLGRGRLEQFETSMRAEVVQQMTLEQQLREAVIGQDFVLHFQPVVRVDTGELVGVEALVRWQHPERGLCYPDTFIPTAESAGLIDAIDSLVLAMAAQQRRTWLNNGVLGHGVPIGINISAKRFSNRSLVSVVGEALARNDLDPSELWLEITETAMMQDVGASLETITELAGLGVHLVVDDFGTGWSSLSYLKQFPVEALKIDRSFVAGLCTNSDDSAIVVATLALATALGLTVIAEGVETEQQRARLDGLGCSFGQGFLFGAPVPTEEFERFCGLIRSARH